MLVYARGISQIAWEGGLSCESLYKAFSGDRNPRWTRFSRSSAL